MNCTQIIHSMLAGSPGHGHLARPFICPGPREERAEGRPLCRRKRTSRAPGGARSAGRARGRETGRVDVTDLDTDPLRQLSIWLNAARAAGQPMPEAMTIATATSDGVPSARLVVLRSLQRGLVFFTDCESDKGTELAANPRAAAVLHWLVPVHRQVRVAGAAERVSEDEADEYWGTRAPAVRLSAAASRQSRVAASRTVLETQARDILARYPSAAAVPRPRRWGGFRVLPSRVEFWQESPDSLHDRIRYRTTDSGWITERLSP